MIELQKVREIERSVSNLQLIYSVRGIQVNYILLTAGFVIIFINTISTAR